ncbi:MAG TPA: imidazole glycerol phosphate synthase subunit HisH [Vicinamibacterales bacterium]|nr:imidazole glycerol phosphate synthase subunit HisH [Vicinamibacterales bacterium]
MTDASIVIVDYGMGNIGSVAHALDLLGGRYVVSNQRDALRHASGVILPGVGAFAAAMINLHALDLVEELSEQVLGRRKPFLGICLGMQLVATDSVENGFSKGLGWVDAHVHAMAPPQNLRVPHVGWNGVARKPDHPLFARIEDNAHFYFDHSFHVACGAAITIASCAYGDQYAAALQQDNILAVQFHPEKSQRNGLKLLRNFLNIVAAC